MKADGRTTLGTQKQYSVKLVYICDFHRLPHLVQDKVLFAVWMTIGLVVSNTIAGHAVNWHCAVCDPNVHTASFESGRVLPSLRLLP